MCRDSMGIQLMNSLFSSINSVHGTPFSGHIVTLTIKTENLGCKVKGSKKQLEALLTSVMILFTTFTTPSTNQAKQQSP
jgi:hypothetical protein